MPVLNSSNGAVGARMQSKTVSAVLFVIRIVRNDNVEFSMSSRDSED